MTRLRGERLRDAEAIHKCYQDLTDALAHIEVKINRKISYNVNFISDFLLNILMILSILTANFKNILSKKPTCILTALKKSWVILRHLTGYLMRTW